MAYTHTINKNIIHVITETFLRGLVTSHYIDEISDVCFVTDTILYFGDGYSIFIRNVRNFIQ